MSINPQTGIITSKESAVRIPNVFVHDFIIDRISKFDPHQLCETEFETGRTQTYGKVLDVCRRVAQWLHKNGVTTGDRISFYSKSYLEYVPSVLAALRVGAAFSYVRHEMIVDKDYRQTVGTPKYVFASEDKVEELVEAGFENIIVYRWNSATSLPNGCVAFEELLRESDEELTLQLDGNPLKNTCVVQFSGGTTGNPKAIPLSHKAVMATLAYESSGIQLTFGAKIENPIHLSFFPTVHLSGFIYRVIPLIHQSNTIIIERPQQLREICEAIQKYKVNVMSLFPVIIIALSRFPDLKKYDLSSWKTCVVVGGPLLPFMQTELKEILELDRIYLRLSMSEMGGTVTVPTLAPGSIGHLCPNTDAKVIDIETGEPVTTPGKLGELYLRGPQRAIGYYKLPEKTYEAMDNEGFFRTEDLVRFDDEFNFYYFDRIIEFIPAENGNKISATELEGIISYTNPDVREVSVIPSKCGPRAIVIPTVWPQDEEEYKQRIIDITNRHVKEEWMKLSGGIALAKDVPRTVLGKHLKRKMRDM